MCTEQKSDKKGAQIILISYICVFFAILFDQITKALAAITLKGEAPYVLIPNVFELRYLENTSAAFSIDPVSILHEIFHFEYFDAYPNAFLTCKMAFFVVLTVFLVVLMVLFYRRVPWNRHYLPLNLITLGLISGAVGNLIDRITHRYVIDFFYFKLIDFPVFNVADIYVTVSVFGLIFAILFFYQDKDWDQLFPPRKKGEAG